MHDNMTNDNPNFGAAAESQIICILYNCTHIRVQKYIKTKNMMTFYC